MRINPSISQLFTRLRMQSDCIISSDRMVPYCYFDGFYKNPRAVRDEALSAEYWRPNPSVPYFISKKSYSGINYVRARIESMIGEPIFDFAADAPRSSVGKFTIGCQGAELAAKIHSDPYMIAALVYLTPDAPLASGTSFFTRIDGACYRNETKSDLDLLQDRPLTVFDHGIDFIETFSVSNVFNRFLIFDGRMLHSPSAYFGTTLATARMVQTFFFNIGRSYRTNMD